MKPIEVQNWGVDIGNVILRGLTINDQKLSEQIPVADLARMAQLVPEALNGLKFLTDVVGPDNVWLIAKAKQKHIEAMRLAFKKFNVYDVTGVKEDQVLFVPDASDKQILLKALELNGHIDDSGEVISLIGSFLPCPIWFAPEESDTIRWLHKIKYNVRVVSGWKQFKQLF